MSRFGDVAIGILLGATGLAGLAYLCSDDFTGFGSDDIDYDGDDKSLLESTVIEENNKKINSDSNTDEEYETDEESKLSDNIEIA